MFFTLNSLPRGSRNSILICLLVKPLQISKSLFLIFLRQSLEKLCVGQDLIGAHTQKLGDILNNRSAVKRGDPFPRVIFRKGLHQVNKRVKRRRGGKLFPGLCENGQELIHLVLVKQLRLCVI